MAEAQPQTPPAGGPDSPAATSLGGRNSMVRPVSALMLGKTAAVLFTFALPLILVRRLSQEEFGLYKQAFLLISTAISIFPLGLAMSAFYFMPRVSGARRGAVAFNILLIYLLIAGGAGLIVDLRPGVLVVIFNDRELVPYAQHIALALALLISGSFLEYTMIAAEETERAAIYITLTQLSKAGLLIAAAIWLGSIDALLEAASIQGTLQLVWALAYMRRRFGRFWRFDWGLLRAQLAYGLPLGVAALLYWFQTQLHLYFVAHRFGPVAYAVYAIGCFDLPLMSILSESVASVLIQRTNDLHSRNQHGELAALLMQSIRNLSWFYLPIFAFLVVAGREVILLLFTAKYIASLPIFLVNCLLIPLMIPAVACDVLVRAYADYRYFLLKVRIVLAAVLIGGMAVGMSRIGPVGAIVAVVLVAAVERLVVSTRLVHDLHLLRGQRAMLVDMLSIAGAAGAAAIVTIPVLRLMAGHVMFAVVLTAGITFSAAYLVFSRPWRLFAFSELAAELGCARLFRWRTGGPAESGRPSPVFRLRSANRTR